MERSTRPMEPPTNDIGPGSRRTDLEKQLGDEERHRNAEAGLSDALSYIQSIVDTVHEPLLVLDGSLCIKTASRAFIYTFGVSREETEERFIYDLGNGQWDIPALRTLLTEVLPKSRSIQDFEVTHDFPVLGRRVMLLNARKLWNEENDINLVLVAIEDITERKRIQEELVRSNEDLQRFAYVAAHDLRSPLNASLNLSKLLERRTEGKLEAEDSRILGLSIESLERLGALMHDILAYSEMSNAPPQQRVLMPLEEPLNIALENLQHHIDRTGADISAGVLPKVPADRTQMVMVFQNLIGNAIKYGGIEELHIRIESVREGSDWRISVKDNGQGFSAEYALSIFEPFRRLHGPNVPGSGIGLATCKRIVERLGGRIWAESIPGEGATFYFTLPVEADSAVVNP